MQSHVNVGIGYDITIKELAYTIAKVINYQGKIEFDDSKPDGSPRKLLNSNKINSMGWSPTMELEPGLIQTYKDYIAR
jgi:GDP-L-fucose synthase